MQRYLDWASDAIRGDLGTSIRSHQPVTEAFRERLPVTLQLAVMATFIGLLVAIPLGAWSAYRAGKFSDRLATTTSFALVGLPPFLMVCCSSTCSLCTSSVSRHRLGVHQRVLTENLRHAFLPALALALTEIAIYTQLLRADMFATLQQDYILAAKARGLTSASHLDTRGTAPIVVLTHHAGRRQPWSAHRRHGDHRGPFCVTGVGRLVIQAIPQKDYPVLQGSVLILATAYLFINTAGGFELLVHRPEDPSWPLTSGRSPPSSASRPPCRRPRRQPRTRPDHRDHGVGARRGDRGARVALMTRTPRGEPASRSSAWG